jgi:hypothetical protein
MRGARSIVFLEVDLSAKAPDGRLSNRAECRCFASGREAHSSAATRAHSVAAEGRREALTRALYDVSVVDLPGGGALTVLRPRRGVARTSSLILAWTRLPSWGRARRPDRFLSAAAAQDEEVLVRQERSSGHQP